MIPVKKDMEFKANFSDLKTLLDQSYLQANKDHLNV
jgi:hypothetical protein